MNPFLQFKEVLMAVALEEPFKLLKISYHGIVKKLIKPQKCSLDFAFGKKSR